MSDGGKGSSPRPFSISQAEYAAKHDTIFGAKPKRWQRVTGCGCYKCMECEIDPHTFLPKTMSTFIVCPDCGNKRCPKSTDHTLACTNSNDPGQVGSRYE